MARTMIKFLPLDFFSVSHRIQWKKLNAVYRLQIPARIYYARVKNSKWPPQKGSLIFFSYSKEMWGLPVKTLQNGLEHRETTKNTKGKQSKSVLFTEHYKP